MCYLVSLLQKLQIKILTCAGLLSVNSYFLLVLKYTNSKEHAECILHFGFSLFP